MSAGELRAVEDRVNEQIRANTPVSVERMPLEAAQAAGALALFGEKYGDEVRVLTMGEERFSVELCGGTHVVRTGDIGLLRITSETGLASGIRRLEAVTGARALQSVRALDTALNEVCAALRGGVDNVADKALALCGRNRELEKELARLKQKLATSAGRDITAAAVDVRGVKVLATRVDGADGGALRGIVDQCKHKLGSGVVLLAAISDNKVALVAGVTGDLTDRVEAGELMREFAPRVGGKGGGRADMAQGGGHDVAALAGALAAVPGWVGAALDSR